MERKEPTLSGIAPDKDEVVARQQRSANRPPRPPTAPPPSGRPPAGGGGSGLAVFALILALIGLGGSGFLAWKFLEAEQELLSSEARIADLERRLDITYDESADSLEAIQAKLQWADSEIRKLWGVSHDTNRGNITRNREQIEALRGELTSARSETGTVKSALEEVTKSVADVRSNLASLKAGVDSVAEHQRRLQNLEESLDRVNDRVAQLMGLPNRVKSNEEAIEAIDAYRRSINRDLLAIKERLGQ